MTVKCALCGTGINPTAQGVGQKVTGWEVKAIAASRKSGSDIIGRQQVPEFACPSCIRCVKLGLNPGQGSMVL
jgi:hypothetical protein